MPQKIEHILEMNIKIYVIDTWVPVPHIVPN